MDPFDLREWNNFEKTGGNPTVPAIVDQVTIDSRRIDSAHSLFVALKGEIHDGHQFVKQAAEAGVKYALVSEQWKAPASMQGITLLRAPDPLKALQEIAKSYRMKLPTRIIGIGGTFGKTMVKDLLLQLLSMEKRAAASPESFNSQLGVALSLLTLRKDDEIAIIEAAISKKQEMDVLADLIRPDFTILTLLGNKHLATLEDMNTVTQETLKLVNATDRNGWSLLPSDLGKYPFLNQAPFYYWDEPDERLPHASPTDPEETIPKDYHLSFPGEEGYRGKMSSSFSYFLNLINMSAKAAWLSGISAKNIKTVFEDYQPQPTRTEIVKTSTGAVFVNDLYCSDPQSIERAVRHFKYANPGQHKIFLFGGMRGKPTHAQSDYKHIGKVLAKAGLQQLFLYGDKPFEPLVAEVAKTSPETDLVIFSEEREALDFLKEHIQPNDYILIKGDKKLSLDTLTEYFNESLSNNQCIINLAAIQTNITLIRKMVPGNRVMVIVKALAYGTDDVQMAKFLGTCGVDILGVADVDEGVALKRAGVTQQIFSINAAIYEVGKVVKWGLEVGAGDADFVCTLAEEAAKREKIINVHLHINTGMGRFGCRPEEALTLAKLIKSFPNLVLEGLMTHFSCADDPKEDEFTRGQISCFDKVIGELKENGIEVKWTHAANSSGATRFSLSQYNMVRIGLAAYGLYSSEAVKQVQDLRLAVSLTSRIVGINVCKKGETVSYGRRYKVEREEQRIAVLPIGYFDGLHRNYSGKSYVLIKGKKAPMIGSICMDYMMVDITDIPHASVGDPVLIFGEDEFGQYLSPEDLASSGNSIVYELITCLGPRIQRIFVYEEGRQIR